MLSSLITLAIGAGIGITWNKLDLHKETIEVMIGFSQKLVPFPALFDNSLDILLPTRF